MTAAKLSAAPTARAKQAAPRKLTKRKGVEVSRTEIGIGAAAVAVAGLALFNVSRAKRSERTTPRRGDLMRVDGVDLHYVESNTSGPSVEPAMVSDTSVVPSVRLSRSTRL